MPIDDLRVLLSILTGIIVVYVSALEFRNMNPIFEFLIILGIYFFVHIFYLIVFSLICPKYRGIAGIMERCELRKEYGSDYCAVCERGYECAKG